MPLSQFEEENHPVKLHSDVFGEDYILSPGLYIQPEKDTVVYYVSEMRLLQKFKEDKEFLKMIHYTKKKFNIRIIDAKIEEE